jgi:LysR family transcriptional regulator, glycine cleavage system transcriptional activator
MSRRLPPLNALRAFEAAARHNSFAGAAAELHVSHAAISRHVRALEARLGVTLFRNARRGVELTSAGARYLATVSQAFDSIAAATDSLADPKHAQIRVSAQPAFAARWLIRRLAGFRAAWPDYEVVLDSTSRLVELERNEADLAIRRAERPAPGLVQDLLAPSRVCPVGAPAVLRGRRMPLRPADLKAFPLLHDDDDGSLWRRWFAAVDIADVEVARGAHILESGLAIDAAIAGQGIVLADDFLIADELADGRLVKLCALAVADWDYCLVGFPDALRRRPIAAFRDWLLAESAGLRAPR